LKHFKKISCLLIGMLLLGSSVYAGGVDPNEIPVEKVVREKVTASPAETSAAVSKARRAVAPKVEEVQIPPAQPKAVAKAGKDDWMLSTGSNTCEPLSAVQRKVKNIGTFKTPKEFAYQMQQRGHQAFAMDIGDQRDQVMRVKVPDMDLDLTFKKAGLCY